MNVSDTKTMLITGAAGGVGRATVHLFAQKGWRVIGVDRAAFGEGFPSSGLFIQSDISVGANLEAIFTQAHAFTERLHALSTMPQSRSPSLARDQREEWIWSCLQPALGIPGIKLAHPLLKAAAAAAS